MKNLAIEILNNESVRSVEAITKTASTQLSAGAPWITGAE